MFFDGKNSIAARNADRFTSSLPSAPDEKEIPGSMAAVICTGVSGSLRGYGGTWMFTAHRYTRVF